MQASPQEYQRRLAEAKMMAACRVRLRFGNRHALVANPKMSKNGKHLNRHKWTLFVELAGSAGSPPLAIGDLVQSVRFKIAPFYTAWPASDTRSVRVGKNPEVRSAPFEVNRIGWGYFDTTMVVTWQPWWGLPPLELEHELSFDDEGASSLQTVNLPQAAYDRLAGSAARGLSRPRAKSSARSTSQRAQPSRPRASSQQRRRTYAGDDVPPPPPWDAS